MRLLSVTVLSLIAVAATAAQLATPPASNAARPSKASQIATGKYIVHDVAMCVNCHSPRLPNGELMPGKLLMGAHIQFTPPDTRHWATTAPRIAGLPKWEDDEVVILLTTGKLETGLMMRRPMPQFHLTEPDARAVVAYLRSLGPKQHTKTRRAFAPSVGAAH